MKKTISIITAGLLILSMLVMLAGCGGGITGRWENRAYDMVKYYIEFTSDGKFEYGSGPQGDGSSESGTYTIDNDGTMHLNSSNWHDEKLKKTTVDDTENITSSDYYAFDDKVLYFRGNEYKKK